MNQLYRVMRYDPVDGLVVPDQWQLSERFFTEEEALDVIERFTNYPQEWVILKTWQ